jgi:hypothetical protein
MGQMIPHPSKEQVNYFISLPERSLRSTSALAGGVIRELSEVVIPASFRRTKLYQTLVGTALRFVVEQVGQVQIPEGEAIAVPDDFILRKTAGNGIEVAGILLFRLSPVWVLAALSDLSRTGRVLVQEIAQELKDYRLLDPETDFETVDQILDGLEKTSGRLSDNINCPPLDVAKLRQEWSTLKEEAPRIPLGKFPTLESLTEAWQNLKAEARAQQCSVFELSSLLALSAVGHLPRRALWLSQCATLAARKTGTLFAGTLLTHYSITLSEIHRTGYLAYWAREFFPYLQAVAINFSSAQASFTEKFLNWCQGRLSAS